jgi:Zn-dependent membrane protease YugP
MFFHDWTFFLIIPPLILALYAQAKVKGAYRKYSQIFASSRTTGAQAATQLLQTAGAGDASAGTIEPWSRVPSDTTTSSGSALAGR